LFIPAGELHAYVSGDMVECMTSSANVLRAGLTHKFRDLDNLLPLLSFRPQMPRIVTPRHDGGQAPTSTEPDGRCLRYDAPGGLFSVSCTRVARGGNLDLAMAGGPSLLLCTAGRGLITAGGKEEKLVFGAVFYIGCGALASLLNDGDEVLVCYRAYKTSAHGG